MGYRSQVKYMIMFPTELLAKEFIAVHSIPEDTSLALEELKYVGDTDRNYPCLFGEFDDVKWSTSFSEVRAHTTLINAAQEQGYATAYSRLGEDVGDIEVEHQIGDHEAFDGVADTYDYMYVSRRIEFGLSTANAVPSKELFIGETK